MYFLYLVLVMVVGFFFVLFFNIFLEVQLLDRNVSTSLMCTVEEFGLNVHPQASCPGVDLAPG